MELVNYMSNYIKYIKGAIIIVGFLVCVIMQNNSREIFNIGAKSTNTELACEINKGDTVEQRITRPFEDIYRIYINLPTFSDRERDGVVSVKVINNGKVVGEKQIDANELSDYEYFEVALSDTRGQIGDVFEVVITATSTTGKSVGVWRNENQYSNILSAALIINGQTYTNAITNIKIEYKTCKLHGCWLYFGLLILGILLLNDNALTKINNISFEHVCIVSLFIAGVIILYFRSAKFENAFIYAEDGKYISRLLNNGFLSSAFSTRSGGTDDFWNVGSYVLLKCSLILNRMFYGYDITQLAFIIGWVANIFWVTVALTAYAVFAKRSKGLSLAMYCCILLIPMGNSGIEVFGRVLNEVFIFPVLASLLLYQIWEQKYTLSKNNMLKQLVILICGMSFPVSFGALGIWMFFGGIIAIRNKKFKEFIFANWINIVSSLIFLMILPSMLGSQGSAQGMKTDYDSIIEFVIARHFIYPLVYLWYNELNDIIVALVFVVIMVFISAANIKDWRKDNCLTQYNIFTIISIACILVSSIMRLSMSSMFSQYEYTYPDRYYYGCNILFLMIFIYAIYVLLYHNKIVMKIAVYMLICNLIVNPKLNYALAESEWALGNSNKYSWEKSIKMADIVVLNEECVKINIPPSDIDGTWYVEMPLQYYLPSSQ